LKCPKEVPLEHYFNKVAGIGSQKGLVGMHRFKKYFQGSFFRKYILEMSVEEGSVEHHSNKVAEMG